MSKFDTFNSVIKTCKYENTYKMAWACALCDLVKNSYKSVVEIKLYQIAELVSSYYWHHAMFFDVHQSRNASEPLILQEIMKLKNEYYEKKKPLKRMNYEEYFMDISTDNNLMEHKNEVVKNIVSILKKDVAWRFKELGNDNDAADLYEYYPDKNLVVVPEDLVYDIRDNYDYLISLICYRWGLIIEDCTYSEKTSMISLENITLNKNQFMNIKKYFDFLPMGCEEKLFAQTIDFDVQKTEDVEYTEYIKMPEKINVHYCSEKLQDFLNNANIICNKIDMNYARDYYKSHRDQFLYISKEMSLRGFKYILTKASDYFVDLSITDDDIVICSKDNNVKKYINIPFAEMGLSSLVTDYKINSDKFFNGTLLRGFREVYNKNINTEVVRSYFEQYGFELISYYDYKSYMDQEKIIVNYKPIVESDIEEKQEIIINDADAECISLFDGDPIVDSNDYISVLANYLGHTYFRFQYFCKKKTIKKISQITQETLDEFGKVRGVGVGKVKDVFNALKTYERKVIKGINDEFDDEEILDNREIQTNSSRLLETIQLYSMYIEDIIDTSNASERKFLSYCNENGFIKTNDFYDGTDQKAHNVKEFCVAKSIGDRKVLDVIKLFEDLDRRIESNRIKCSDSVFELIKNLTVNELLDTLNIKSNSNVENILEKCEIKVSDIYNNVLDLKNDCSADLYRLEIYLKNNVGNILSLEESAKINSNNGALLENAKLKTEDIFVITEKISGKTLEEIGSEIGVTRERVRQRIAKTFNKIADSAAEAGNPINALVNAFKIYFKYNESQIIFKKDLHDLIDNELLEQIFYQNLIEGIYYNSEFEFITCNYEASQKRLTKDYFEDIDSTFGLALKEDVDDKIIGYIYDNFETLFEDLSKNEDVIILIINNIYNELELKVAGEYVSLGERITKAKLVGRVVIDYMDGFIEINDQQIEKVERLISEHAKKHISFKEGNAVKNINSLVSRLEEFLQVDSKIYRYERCYTKEDINLLSTCVREILNEYDRVAVIEFEKRLPSELQNKFTTTELHSMIRKFLSDICLCSSGKSLEIMRLDNANESKLDIIEREIKANGTLDVNYFVKKYGWSKTSITMAFERCEDTIYCGNGKYKYLNKETIDKEALSYIEEQIRSEIDKNGFATFGQLYDDVCFNVKVYKTLQDYNVTDETMFKNFTRSYCNVGSYKFTTKAIMDMFGKYDSPFDYMFDLLNDEFSATDMKELIMNRFMYSYQEVLIFDSYISDRKMAYKINESDYIKAKKVVLSDEERQKVYDYVDKTFEGKNFIMITDMYGFYSELPKKDFEWTPLLVFNVVNDNKNYRLLERTYRTGDYIDCKYILVKANNLADTYAEFIVNMIKAYYSGNMYEKEIAAFLVSKKVYSGISIPHEVFDEKLMEVDDYGYTRFLEKELNEGGDDE